MPCICSIYTQLILIEKTCANIVSNILLFVYVNLFVAANLHSYLLKNILSNRLGMIEAGVCKLVGMLNGIEQVRTPFISHITIALQSLTLSLLRYNCSVYIPIASSV